MSAEQERSEYMVRYRVWINDKVWMGGYYYRGDSKNFGLYKTKEGALSNTEHWIHERELHRFVIKREEL